MDEQRIMETALRQSAYDCSCAPEDFLREGNSVHEARVSPEARKYLELPLLCDLVSYGSNIVASCRRELMPDLERYINGASAISDCFETPELYQLNELLAAYDARVCYMAHYFLPEADRIFGRAPDCAYELRLLEPEAFAELYLPQWSNALCRARKDLDVLCVGAYDRGKLIGLAGCSADCASMWQIGVDVLPAYRRQGVASALTNRLARETFHRGKVPFYCAAWSNVKSVRNALSSGFRPGWVQVTAKSNAFIRNLRAPRDPSEAGERVV